MPITKDTPKYAAILLASNGSTELIFAADDKRRATSEGLAEYVAEKEDTESQIDQPTYVEPAWDLYIREREVAKLVTAVENLIGDQDFDPADLEEIQEALDNL